VNKFLGTIRASLNSQTAGVRETWQRLGRIDLAARPVILTLIISHVLTVSGFELGRIGKEPLLVLAIALMAEVLFWASYLTLYAIQIWLKASWTSVFARVNTIVVSHLVRIFALEYAYLQFGLTEELSVSERVLGDITGVVILLVGIAYIQLVLQELGTQEFELAAAKEGLTEQGRISRISAETADQLLRAKAQQTLGEQLTALTQYLKSAKSPKATRISSEISELIQNKVRPLSADLWNQLDAFETQTGMKPKSRKTRLPRRISPATEFRAPLVFVLAVLNIFVPAPGLSDLEFALMFGLVMLSFPALGRVLSLLYPKSASHPLALGALATALLALVAWLPSMLFLLVNSESHPGLRVLSFTSTSVILFVSIAVAIWSAFKRERLEYLGQIKLLNQQRARQLALLDQAVWVARRHWSYLVHGTVQGALTVALSRLQLAEKITPELIAQVLSDVERAKSALEENQEFGQKWATVLPQISQTWDGVCELKHEITAAANKVLDENPAASTCVTEILKELVSNAFRHGKATQVSIRITLDEIGDLHLVSTNNGLSVAEDRIQGIGSEMFDELTSSWSWKNTPKGPRLTAVVPVSTNPRVNQATS